MKVKKSIELALLTVFLSGLSAACSLQTLEGESEADKATFAADNKALITQILGDQKKVVHGMVMKEPSNGENLKYDRKFDLVKSVGLQPGKEERFEMVLATTTVNEQTEEMHSQTSDIFIVENSGNFLVGKRVKKGLTGSKSTPLQMTNEEVNKTLRFLKVLQEDRATSRK